MYHLYSDIALPSAPMRIGSKMVPQTPKSKHAQVSYKNASVYI